jgi:hypothetical protein
MPAFEGHFASFQRAKQPREGRKVSWSVAKCSFWGLSPHLDSVEQLPVGHRLLGCCRSSVLILMPGVAAAFGCEVVDPLQDLGAHHSRHRHLSELNTATWRPHLIGAFRPALAGSAGRRPPLRRVLVARLATC